MLSINNRDINGRAFIAILYLILAAAIMTMANADGRCGNLVDIDVVKAGTSLPVDTLLADSSYELRILMENNDTITATTMAFQNWSPDVATWQWEDVGGLGFEGFITIAEGSRLDIPPMGALDMTGLLVREWDIDTQGHDTVVYGGVALYVGIAPGPLEPMISFHFIPGSPQEYGYATICFDSAYVPPTGDFVWGDQMGYDVYPEVAWPEGGQCWTVAACACRPGDANDDTQKNVGDAVYLINHVFKSGPPPVPYNPCSGDANNDCVVNVGDAVYMINYVFKAGPAPPDCWNWRDACGPFE
jgi:hypothetical protein